MSNPVTKHFDHLADRYSQSFTDAKTGKNFEFRKRAELVGSLVRGSTGTLLDCACGTGEVTASTIASGSFSRIVLVDASEMMLDRARTRVRALAGGEIDLHHTDIFAFEPPPSEQFDVILCIGLIAHTGELPRLLSRLARMLKCDGKILLQTSLTDHLGVRVVRRLSSRSIASRQGYSLSYFSLADITRLSQMSGLEVKVVRRYCFGLPWGDRLLPIANHWLERAMAPVSTRLGAEAIFVLTHRT